MLWRPELDSYLEWVWGPFKICEAARDSDGRPLAEAASSIASKLTIPFQTKVSHYTDSRRGRPMNISALRQMTQHWPEIVRATAFLRREYDRHTGCKEMTLWHLWRFMRMMTALVSYLLRRAKDPIEDGSLPTVLCSVVKAGQGLILTAARVPQEDFSVLDRKVETETFLDWAEMGGDYNHPNGGACAAPLNMIREYVKLVLEGGEGACDDEAMRAIIGDMDAALEYGEQGITIVRLKELVHFYHRRLALDLRQTDPLVFEELCAMKKDSPTPWTWPYDPDDDLAIVQREETNTLVLLNKEPNASEVWRSWPPPALPDADAVAAGLREKLAASDSPQKELAAKLIPSLLKSLAVEASVRPIGNAKQRAILAALGRPAADVVDHAAWARVISYSLSNVFAKWAGFAPEARVG